MKPLSATAPPTGFVVLWRKHEGGRERRTIVKKKGGSGEKGRIAGFFTLLNIHTQGIFDWVENLKVIPQQEFIGFVIA